MLKTILCLTIVCISATNTQSQSNYAISTHVLDIANGQPGANIPVQAYYSEYNRSWRSIGNSTTDRNGRVDNVHKGFSLRSGTYMLRFKTNAYDRWKHMQTFYPYIEVIFQVSSQRQHYHVPLIISNYGYSTYKGQQRTGDRRYRHEY